MTSAALKLPDFPPELIDASLAEARAELWRQGEVEILRFHAGQLFIDEKYRAARSSLVVLNISRQWGKTFYAVGKASSQCLKKKRSRVRIGAAFQNDLEEFILPAFEDFFSPPDEPWMWAPKDIRPKFLAHKSKYIFKNGSQIKLVGLDKKPNGLRGNSIDLIIVDEAGFVKNLERLHKSVIVPLTTHRPNARILIQSTAPEEPDHDFWNFVERAKLEGSYSEFTIDECPIISKSDIARIEHDMGGRDTSAFKREYLCMRIVETERAIIPEFDEKRHVRLVPRPKYFQHVHRYESLDSGVRDLTVVLLGYYDFPRAVLVIEDEVVLQGSAVTTRNIRRKTRAKEKSLSYENVYRRPADNDNLILLNDLGADDKDDAGNSEPGILFYPTGKDSLDAMINAVRLMFSDNRIEICPEAKILSGTLRSCLWNSRRDDYERHKVYGHADAIASLVYLVRNLDRHTNPIPAWFDVSQSETILIQHPNATISDTARALAGAINGGLRR